MTAEELEPLSHNIPRIAIGNVTQLKGNKLAAVLRHS